MPRLPKYLLQKEWLTFEDVKKVFQSAPSELENVMSRDESDEFCHSYKFVCTFCPRQCQQEFSVYRFESSARQGMRKHLKWHVNTLKSEMASDDHTEFLTRNQLYQQTRGQKHKLAVSKSEAPSAKVVKQSSRAKSSVSVKSPGSPVSEPPTKRKRYTKIKKVVSNENDSSKSSDKVDLKEVPSSPSSSDVKIQEPIVVKEESEVSKKLDNVPQLIGLEDEQNVERKKNTQTQTDRKAKLKGLETPQYKIAVRLFAVDKSQWSNIDKVLNDIIVGENASAVITENDKAKMLMGMSQWIEAVKYFEEKSRERIGPPLNDAERSVLNSLKEEDWRNLDQAQDTESKIRLTAYASYLLRDYDWYPRKLKPKTCEHCGKTYTASTSLYSHLVSLSGIRVWLCCKCCRTKGEVSFTRKHSLQYHILKEVGIPRYRCREPGCSKTHNHTHHQKSHARQHTGEKRYICEFKECVGKFSNRNTYSRHLLQYHNIELTRKNKLCQIDAKEAKVKVLAARWKARERSKHKRQKTDDKDKDKDKNKDKPVEQRALTRLTCNKQNETSPDSADVSFKDLEKFMRPTASQLLSGIARDVRNTTIEGTGKSSDSNLGGLNLLATVSKYMNVESCDGSSESQGKEQFDKISTGSYTKLIEALDISPNSPTTQSNQIPILSSLDAGVKKSVGVSAEASSNTKPSKLLPFPFGQTNIKDENCNLSFQKLPNVIQGLKERLYNPPSYALTLPSVTPNVLKTSTLQTVSAPSQPKFVTGKIIVNLSQVQPVCTSAAVSEFEKPRGNISTLNSSFNQCSKEDRHAGTNTVVTSSTNKNNSNAVLLGKSGKRYILVASANNGSECFPIPIGTQLEEKTIPFSQL